MTAAGTARIVRGFFAALAAAVLAVAGTAGHAVTARAATVTFSDTPLRSWTAAGTGYAVAVVGTTAYVGGSFSSVTSPGGTTVARANLAAFDVTTGALVPTFRADTNGAVRALAYDGTNLYVGGSFTSIGGVTRYRLAALDPATGAVRRSWIANASSNVYALAVSSDKLYVAGSFSSFDGATRLRVAAVRLPDGSLDSFAPAVNYTVNSIAAARDDSRIYIGGAYTAVDGVSTKYLTALTATGAVARTGWQALSGPVLDAQLFSNDSRLAVAVGGAGNQGAVYDPATGNRLWRQVCDGDGQAVAFDGGAVYTGFHEGCNGDTTIRLTSNDAVTGVRDTSFTPSFDLFWGVRGISGTSAVLVVVGDFTRVSGVPAQGFAIFPAA